MFTNLQALKISQGDVVKIETSGVVLWELITTKYTNQVPISIDTNGTIYDGDGWIAKKRLSSSGALKDANHVSTTGFIPASSGAKIRIGGCKWIDTTNASGSNYVCSYDANFNFVCAVNCEGGYGGGTVSGNDKVAIVTLPSNSNIAYVRVSAYASVIDGAGATLIVTVNEEITE